MAATDGGVRALGQLTDQLLREPRVPAKMSRNWCRRRGLTGGAATSWTGGFVEAAAEPGWSGGLSLGGGFTLRLSRPVTNIRRTKSRHIDLNRRCC